MKNPRKKNFRATLLLVAAGLVCRVAAQTAVSFNATNDLASPLTVALWQTNSGGTTFGAVTAMPANTVSSLATNSGSWTGVAVLNPQLYVGRFDVFTSMADSNGANLSYVITNGYLSYYSSSTPVGTGTSAPPAGVPLPISVWAGTNANPNGIYTAGYGSLYNQFDATGTNFIQQWIKTFAAGNTNWAVASGGAAPSGVATNISGGALVQVTNIAQSSIPGNVVTNGGPATFFNPVLTNPILSGTISGSVTGALPNLTAGAVVFGHQYLDDTIIPVTNTWTLYSFQSNALAQIPVNAAMRAAACPTPPMYFEMYDAYGERYTPWDFTNDVWAMVTNGWVAAGYNTIVYDNGIATNRDANGHWVPALQGMYGGAPNGDLNPNGPQSGNYKLNIPVSVPWALSMGVKTWVYTEANAFQLSHYLASGGGTYPVADGTNYLESDIAWFITNGIAGLKFDVNTQNGASVLPDHVYWDLRAAAAIDATGKPFVLDMSTSPATNYQVLSPAQFSVANTLRVSAAGLGRPGAWGMDYPQPYAGNSFWNNLGGFATNASTSPDTFSIPKWVREIYLMDSDLMTYWMKTPGHYIDHESFMLDTTNTAQWAMSWNAIMGNTLCPLIIPDSPTFNIGAGYNFLRQILKNPDIIAIDQDAAQAPSIIVQTNGGFDIGGWWVNAGYGYMTNANSLIGSVVAARPLGAKSVNVANKIALGFFNRSISNSAAVSCGFTNVGIPQNTPVYVYDIWGNSYSWATNGLAYTVAPNACKMFLLWPQRSLATGVAPTAIIANNQVIGAVQQTNVTVYPQQCLLYGGITTGWSAPDFIPTAAILPATGGSIMCLPLMPQNASNVICTWYIAASATTTLTNEIIAKTYNYNNGNSVNNYTDQIFQWPLTNGVNVFTQTNGWEAVPTWNLQPGYALRWVTMQNTPGYTNSANVHVIKVVEQFNLWTNTPAGPTQLW